MRKKNILIILSIFLFVIPQIGGLIQNVDEFTPIIKTSDLTETIELTADADLFTQVRKGTDIDVYAGGATPFLRLGLWDDTYDLGGYLSEIYIRFSLPKIESITSMILKLSYWDGYPSQQDIYYDINASLVSNDWVESNGVWTERPAYLGTSTIVYLHNPTFESDIYFNLTSLSGGISDTMITIHLCPNNLTRIRYPDPFLTSENSATPRLILEYDLPPNITINSPAINQIFGSNAPSYDITILDADLDSLWYRLDNGTIITDNVTTPDMNGLIEKSIWDSIGNGTVTIRFFANDTMGNIGSSEVIVRKDIKEPLISINSPNPNGLIGSKAPRYNITILEANLDSLWYRLDNGTIITENVTTTDTNGLIEEWVWESVGNGTVTIQFFANDTLGNVGSSQIIVKKNIFIPIIIIDSPLPNNIFSQDSPNFTIYVSGIDLNSTWYTIDYGLTNFTFSGLTGTINQSAWSAQSDGQLSLTFYLNNSDGTIGFDEIIIIKDTLNPLITVISPLPNELFGSDAPTFIVEITDANDIDGMWYTIDNGINNYTFTSNNTINQAAWNLLADPTVLIRFYANDTVGRIGLKEISIEKDTINPLITIYKPSLSETCGIFAPIYEIDINETNLDTFWYSIDGGSTIIIITELMGALDQALWSSLPEGPVTIRFYANDTVGNIGFRDVVIYKNLGNFAENFNIKIFAIIIGAIFLGLGVVLAIIFVTKVKSIKSVKKKRKTKTPTVITQKGVVQEIPTPQKPVEKRRISLKEFEKLSIDAKLIDQSSSGQEMEISKQKQIDRSKREIDKGKVFSFIGGIIGLLAVFTPASYTVISLYGINILSWYMWMFGFHYYNDIVDATDLFMTGDRFLLEIQVITTAIVIVFNVIVLIKATKFRTPTSRHSFFSARSAIALFLAMIFYILVFEIWGQLSVGVSFWAVQSLGFGVIGQFVASGVMLIGHFLSKKSSRFMAPIESELDQEEIYKTSDSFLDNNLEIIRLHQKGIILLEKKVEFLISKQNESEILEKIEYEKAIEYFQEAVDLSPNQPINYSKINLDLAYKIIGEEDDKKRALDWLDEIKENTDRIRHETLWYLS